jgi:hypothetical protein
MPVEAAVGGVTSDRLPTGEAGWEAPATKFVLPVTAETPVTEGTIGLGVITAGFAATWIAGVTVWTRGWNTSTGTADSRSRDSRGSQQHTGDTSLQACALEGVLVCLVMTFSFIRWMNVKLISCLDCPLHTPF